MSMPNTAIPDGFASTNGSITVTVVLRDRVVTERGIRCKEGEGRGVHRNPNELFDI